MALNATREQLIHEALKEVWGYPGFRPHQEATIEAIMSGRDSLTVLPTGGGKSLCYQLPASLMPGTAVVVSPLISLMADQVQALRLLGVPAAFVNSSQSGDEIRKTKAQLFQGRLKLLYISPERLLLEHFKEELKLIGVSFFAIDEAHCISQWGHDFRPEYTQLGQLKTLFPHTGMHAFTATAPPVVQKEVLDQLGLKQPLLLVGSYYRANLKYRVLRRQKLKRQLQELVGSHNPGDNGIVYCLTRKETERTAAILNEQGFKALPYHAGLDAETRKRHQVLFSQEKVPIMVATVAFGMGIDQSNVRFVIHAGMPRTLSHYQQEAGRAGRDGLPAECTLIYAARDILFWKRIIEEEASLAENRLDLLQDMIHYASQIKCRHKTLVEYFGQEFEKEACGNCDVCLGEVETMGEARKISRMILSGVLKVRQGFGGAYVAQVLTGSKDKKVLMNGHERLSLYGILGEYGKAQVHDWIDQLADQKYLGRSGSEYPTLSLTQAGYWLLRPDKFAKQENDVPVYLIETRKPATATRGIIDEVAPFDHGLFERLRQKRMGIAADLGVPAFMVFGDKSLQDMARGKPTDDAGFLEVFGVGTHKLQKFGEPMLRAIQDYLTEEESADAPKSTEPT